MIPGQVGNCFERASLEAHLDSCDWKTLGQLDRADVFAKAKINPGIKGIAGDVVEQSILSLKPNPHQEPDITIDGEEWEVKTTGVKKSKNNPSTWEAKEPMSITSVSPEKITKEEYSVSSFWHKIERMLFFYYHYDSPKTIKDAFLYSRFPLIAHQFHRYEDFSESDRNMLEADWRQVQMYVRHAQETLDNPEEAYPGISHNLRKVLLLLDTAPKWPNRPRFRFKRTFVSSIIQRHFLRGKVPTYEKLDAKIESHRDLDDICFALQRKSSGLTIDTLCKQLKIHLNKGCTLKSITEPIVVRMFGAKKSTKMSQVDFFRKVGVVAKSFVVTKQGRRTEDAKFFTIDFDEIANPNLEFEDSQFYEFFSSTRILVAVFEEPDNKSPLEENVFKHFRTITFDDEFIYGEVKSVWDKIRDLVINKKLVDEPVLDRHGVQIVNKNGELRSAPNLPKSSEGLVFVRGTGSDSKDKRECVNGVRMYHQQVWIKGSYIAELVSQAF